MKPANLGKITAAFSVQAEGFEAVTPHLSKREYLDYTVQKTSPAPADTVLEVAAGTCLCGRSLAPHVAHVVCLDATPAMLEAGKAACARAGLRNLSFMAGYAEDLPFPDNSFDIVISRLAFHHFAHIEKPFSEMVRVLKPGGKLVMIDMAVGCESHRHEIDRIERLRDLSHTSTLSRAQMRDLYSRNGLALVVQEQTDVPVQLEAWMELSKPSEHTRATIRELMGDDLAGKHRTGFSPYLVEGGIAFDQHWVFNLGIKGAANATCSR